MHTPTMFKMIVAVYIWVILLSAKALDAKIGINWGRTTNLVPSMVVDLLLQNKISEVKLYNINDDVIKAFAGTGIGVSITIFKPQTISTIFDAKEYVVQKIAPFPDVNIKYVLVGNNAFANARISNVSFNTIVDALKLVQNALDELGFGDRIKAVLTHSFTGVVTLYNAKPSDASFVPDVKQAMADALAFMNSTNAPFMFDFFPIAHINAYNLDPNFAFMDNKSTHVVTDINGFVYNNVFDFVFDAFVWALKKAGYDNLKIVVTQIGWPTDGTVGANAEWASRFWKGLLPLVMSNRGTPMRPGAPIDIYIHSLTDEKKNPVYFPFMRHWGIYRSNGEPKYKIDLTGQGRDIFPTNAKGINLMPSRWCVFNGDTSDKTNVDTQFQFACKRADCTSLAPGGSCSMLTAKENVSYAFNAYFQSNFQDDKSCRFEGLGKVVVQNPSRDGCVFLVDVVRGNTKPSETTKWG